MVPIVTSGRHLNIRDLLFAPRTGTMTSSSSNRALTASDGPVFVAFLKITSRYYGFFTLPGITSSTWQAKASKFSKKIKFCCGAGGAGIWQLVCSMLLNLNII